MPMIADSQEPSPAPSVSGPPEGARLEEVVVTAEKRPERLLDVPMSITVLTGRELERQGATTLKDIASEVPALSTVEFSPGQARTQLRGISSLSGTATIGTYLDEIPINVDSVQLGTDVRFIDLDRIEVLRGPQGTLYGEGSMGGTIKYITRNPDLRDFSVSLGSALGTMTDGTSLYRADGALNAPLVPGTVAVRLVGGYEKTPGWIDYPLIGASDVNKGTSTTGRVKALWQATPALKVMLEYAYQDSDYDSQNYSNAERTAPYVALQPSLDTNRLSNIVLDLDARDFSVLSSTSYMDRSVAIANDVTGYFAPIYYAPPPAGFGVSPGTIRSVLLDVAESFKATSEELRFASKAVTPVKWTAGVYYRDYREIDNFASVTTPNPLPVQLLQSATRYRSTQLAGFGEMAYGFWEKGSATLGVRYFRDQRNKSGSGASFGTPTAEPYGSATFTSFDPRAILSYSPARDMLLYASASKGFRSGGFNLVASRPPGCNLPTAYDPEALWTYEVGANLSFDDQRIVVQAAGYHNDWRNIQVGEFCPGGQATQLTNGGKARGNGVDLQMTALATHSLTFSLSGSFNDSKFEDNSAAHLSGDHVDFVPMFTGAVATDYRFQLAHMRGNLHIDYQYEDRYSIAVRDFGGSSPLVYSDSWGKLNARLSFKSSKWEAGLFATNLTDANRILFPTTGVLLVPVRMTPRTYGVDLRYND